MYKFIPMIIICVLFVTGCISTGPKPDAPNLTLCLLDSRYPDKAYCNTTFGKNRHEKKVDKENVWFMMDTNNLNKLMLFLKRYCSSFPYKCKNKK